MPSYATRPFARFFRKAGLARAALLQAAEAVKEGHFDADLGGGVFKQRIARVGGGKSSGFRTIIFFKAGGHCFFAYGFAKNRKANISKREMEALKDLAAEFLGYDEEQLGSAIAAGEFLEIRDDGEEGVEPAD